MRTPIKMRAEIPSYPEKMLLIEFMSSQSQLILQHSTKIIYWNKIFKIKHMVFQRRLLKTYFNVIFNVLAFVDNLLFLKILTCHFMP